jgi:hypothetical protein
VGQGVAGIIDIFSTGMFRAKNISRAARWSNNFGK